MELGKHLHPYIRQNTNLTFSYDLDKYNKYKFKINYNGDAKVENTVKFFKLEEIYETHLEEIQDLHLIKKRYSESYLYNLKRILIGTSISKDELYRLAFGVYIEESKFDRRPLSRMKRDLLEELRII